MNSGKKDWVKVAKQSRQFERMEAYFEDFGFTPHRHDTFAIGQTLGGIHNFNYRKSLRHSLPGGTVVIHPDELHDGEAGNEMGFYYRILYVSPELIQEVLGPNPLPFLEEGITRDVRLGSVVQNILCDLDSDLDPLDEDDKVYELATTLSLVSGQKVKRKTINYAAANKAREFILDCLDSPLSLEQIEAVADTDRWSLSRDFRAVYGTSPYRYLTLRRLDKVKAFIQCGLSLTDASIEAGFSDQSHMTNKFCKAFGMSPGTWRKLSQ